MLECSNFRFNELVRRQIVREDSKDYEGKAKRYRLCSHYGSCVLNGQAFEGTLHTKENPMSSKLYSLIKEGKLSSALDVPKHPEFITEQDENK